MSNTAGTVTLPVINVGSGTSTGIVVGGGASGNLLSGLSTFPIFQLTGISKGYIYFFILMAFILYWLILLYTDGDILFDGFLDTFRVPRSK